MNARAVCRPGIGNMKQPALRVDEHDASVAKSVEDATIGFGSLQRHTIAVPVILYVACRFARLLERCQHLPISCRDASEAIDIDWTGNPVDISVISSVQRLQRPKVV